MRKEDIDFRFLAEHSVDVIARTGVDRVIRYISPSCFRQFGWKPEEMMGELFDRFMCEEGLAETMDRLRGFAESTVENDLQPIRAKRKDGSLVWTEASVRIVRDAGTGKPVEMVVAIRDITERKRVEEKLAALAMTDGLTGLANRRAFDEALEREWKRTLREGTQMSLLLLDIDHFKRFNDENGHQVGDDCLRAVAAATAGAVRATDTVARYGGEEIAVILPAVNAAGAAEAAEKVRAAIVGLGLTHHGNPEGGGWVTVSIGAATALARHGGTMTMQESLLQTADKALYKAKRGGRNRVELGIVIATQEVQYA